MIDKKKADEIWNKRQKIPVAWDYYKLFFKDKQEWKPWFYLSFDSKKKEKKELIESILKDIILNLYKLNRFTDYETHEWSFLNELTTHFHNNLRNKNYFNTFIWHGAFNPQQFPKS